MAIDLDSFEPYVKIIVVGVGGGGSNAVNKMVNDVMMKTTIDFVVFNTDAQALSNSKAPMRFVLGEEITKGLGAGGDPEVGFNAAEASKDKIKEILTGYDMVFIACGEGGGTGTGAAPVIAKIAKDLGALTIAIVTRPFTFEGNKRIKKASEGIIKLKENVDSIIIISNDKLMFMKGKISIKEAFHESDEVLAQSVKTITNLILLPGIINLDFADIRNVLKDKGMALIGFGEGKGENKAKDAANNAISCPLLEVSIRGAKQAIINITCGEDVTLDETSSAVRYLTELAGGDVNIIFGVQTNPDLGDAMLVSVIATEFDESSIDNSSLITTRDGKTIENSTSETKEVQIDKDKVNPAQVGDTKPDFSENDNVLPDFFNRLESEASKDDLDTYDDDTKEKNE